MDKKRILIIDDEVGATRWLQSNLEQTQQYIVRVENVATAALTSAQEFRPDLVLMDVLMPGLDGGELAQRFQDSRTMRPVPIVFLTAAATKREVSKGGGRIGGLPFLAKPVDMAELIACMEKHLGLQASAGQMGAGEQAKPILGDGGDAGMAAGWQTGNACKLPAPSG